MPGERRTVGDDRGEIARTMRELATNHRAIVMTGGLGPTLDDLTRESLGDVVDPGAQLLTDPAGAEHLRGWFEKRGRPMPHSNLRQAMRPPSARLLDNPEGTAPGLAAHIGACAVFCLPGPPNEMRPMFVQVKHAFLTTGRNYGAGKFYDICNAKNGAVYSSTAYDVLAVYLWDRREWVLYSRAELGGRHGTTFTPPELRLRAVRGSGCDARDPNNWHLLDEVAESLTANQKPFMA